MNEKIFLNICRFVILCILYYSGILGVIFRILLKNGFYIFNYHSFNTFTNDHFRFGSLFESNYEKNFSRQIQFYSKFFESVHLERIDQDELKKKSFLVTFDDGYSDNYTIAYPELKRNSVTSIFFITTSMIGVNSLLWFDYVRLFFEQHKRKLRLKAARTKKECKSKLSELKLLNETEFKEEMERITSQLDTHPRMMMNWKEVRECHTNGIVIAPHTHTHPIFSRLARSEQEEEIVDSINTIQSMLQIKSIPHFGIPEGKMWAMDETTIDILMKNGIKYVYLTEYGKNRKYDQGKKIHLFNRIGINPSDPIPLIMMKIIKANLKG